MIDNAKTACLQTISILYDSRTFDNGKLWCTARSVHCRNSTLVHRSADIRQRSRTHSTIEYGHTILSCNLLYFATHRTTTLLRILLFAYTRTMFYGQINSYNMHTTVVTCNLLARIDNTHRMSESVSTRWFLLYISLRSDEARR